LVSLAIAAAAVLAHPDWPRLLKASLVPVLSLGPCKIAGGLALLGTTLTGYFDVWETVGRGVEKPPDGTPEGGGLARARAGAVVGAYWTGWQFADQVHLPAELSNWTAVAVLLAADTPSGATRRSGIFRGAVAGPEVLAPVDGVHEAAGRARSADASGGSLRYPQRLG
jgi:hypothetical protein